MQTRWLLERKGWKPCCMQLFWLLEISLSLQSLNNALRVKKERLCTSFIWTNSANDSMPNCHWAYKKLKKLGFKILGIIATNKNKILRWKVIHLCYPYQSYFDVGFSKCVSINVVAYLLTFISVYILNSGDWPIFGKAIEKYQKLFLMGKLFLMHSLKH